MSENTGQKKIDSILAIILIVFSGYIISEAFSMKVMDQYAPGPGMFPLGVGILIAVLSVGMLIDSLNPKIHDKESMFKNKAGLLSSAKMFAGLVLYVFLLDKLGYIIMSFLLVCYIMLVVSKSSIKKTLLTAAVITLLLFLIFQVGLKITLPKGPFGF